MNRMTRGASLASCYIFSIALSAWLVSHYGAVPVGFGLMAPAGAYIIGFTMVFRDLTQDQLGPRWTYLALIFGSAISVLVSPTLALASAAAFFLSETVDQIVYTPLRRRYLALAVITSNIVGSLVDTMVFLYIAFGSMELFAGQMWAKIASSLAAVVLLKVIYMNRQTITPAYYKALKEKEAA